MNVFIENKNAAMAEASLKKILLLLALSLAAFSTVFISPALAAENVSSTINITIQVGAKTIVKVDPDVLEWIGGQAIDPGSEGVAKAIQIENMGSTNISRVWANTTFESSSPFGTGNASRYDAANFIALSKTNGTSDYYYFVNRVDYNETHQDIYLTLPANWVGYGRFRDGNSEYFWTVVRGATNCTDGTFYIGKNPHNSTTSGTIDFSNCDPTLNNSAGAQACRSGTLTAAAGGNWGYGFVFVGPNANYHNYTAAVNADCNVTMFSHWNIDAPGGSAPGTYVEYLYSTTLYPGGAVIVYAKAKVAYGTAAGTIAKGFLTIIAESI